MTRAIFLTLFLVCSHTGNALSIENTLADYSESVRIDADNFSEQSDFAVPSDSSGSRPAEQKNQPAEEFSQGYQNWQAYGSIACCDDGKGEMYAFHIGYGYFMYDDFSLNVDVLGSYIRSDIDDDGVAIGLDLILRRHQFKSQDNLWTLYIEAGSGLQQ